MDKNRARITIKFGQAKNGAQATSSADRVELPKERLAEKAADQQNPADEPNRLDEAYDPIPAQKEVAAGEESFDDFEAFGPKYIPKEDRDTRLISTKRRTYKSRLHASREINAKQLLGVMASVCGAIAVGLIFGFIVLLFFKSGFMDQAETSGNIKSPAKTEQVQVSEEPAPAKTEAPPAAGAGQSSAISKVSVTLPATKIFAVQGGVFQDRQSAQPMIEKIKSKGWPSYFSGDNPASLFLGLALNRDHALSMANQFKEMDVYIKELQEEPKTVSVSVNQGSTLSQEEWDQWSGAEEAFRQKLGEAIGQGLSAGKLEAELMNGLKDAHRHLLTKGRELFSKMPAEQQSLGNHLLNDYTKSVSAMERYQKQPANGYLWQSEQAILDAYESGKNLVSSFK